MSTLDQQTTPADQSPPSSGVSEDDLALLTPEERAAIADDDDSANLDALKRLAAGAPDDDNGEGGENEVLDEHGNLVPSPADATAPVPAASQPVSQPDAKPAKPAEAVETPSPKSAPVPVYTAELPADFAEQQQALKADIDALRAKFKAGDIELEEYELRREAYAERRIELDTLRTKAEISQDMRRQNSAQQWRTAIDSVFDMAAKPENGGIDYRVDQEKSADLDAFVKQLASNPSHVDKSMDWFLQEGHKRVLALNGLSVVVPPKKDPTPTPPPSRKPPLATIPTSLAQIPGSDGPGDVANEFASVDALDGEDLERAIARMTPVQLDRYMRAR